jgi:two-component system, cell cycle sensor histidine kinase and response regulator CckA
VVADIGKLLQPLIGEDIQIVTESQGGLGAIRADRGRVEQILMNLATNARDATASEGTLSIRTENVQLGDEDVARYRYVKPNPYVHMAVSDTGTGVSEEVRSRVFEPFFTTKKRGAVRDWAWQPFTASLNKVAVTFGFRAHWEREQPSMFTCRR